MDFQSSRAANLDGLPDPDVLRRAADQGRILVSHDENSMPGHFRDYLAGGNSGPGVLIVPQRILVGLVIESIVLIWLASDADEWTDQIAWLPL